MLRALRSALLVLPLVVVGPLSVGAQTVAVPDFTVSTGDFGDHVQDVDVAVGDDGTIAFIWGEYDSGGIAQNMAATRRFGADGTALGGAIRVDTSRHVFSPTISADARGGFVAAWQWIRSGQEYAYFGQILDGNAAAVTSDFQVDFENGGSTSSGAVAGLPSGAIFVFKQLNQLWGHLHDPAGQSRGPAFSIGAAGAGFDQDVARLPDGGFVATWTNTWLSEFSWARLYDGDGTPRGPAFAIGADFFVKHVAASPLGGFAAAGFRWSEDDDTAVPWVRRFADDGTFLWERRIEIPPPGTSIDPDLAFDHLGKLYVVWNEYRFREHVVERPRARGLDLGGNLLGLGFWAADEPANEIRTAALPDGGFANVWYRSGRVRGNVIALDPSSGVVCGDGVLAPGFEECDAGAGNSDTAPDTCRTNCMNPRCGDGVIDSAEECDDGNGLSCDGCSGTCRLEPGAICGDGILEHGCEECDDGNTTWGDGCAGHCRLERIPGGGSKVTDCWSAWSINNPANSPRYDRAGGVSAKQRCTDNDPRCDFDGGRTGSCTFLLRVCANNTDHWACTPAPLGRWIIRSPSAKRALKIPALAALRTALENATAALIDAPASDVCTDAVAVEVPLRGTPERYRRGKLALSVQAVLTDGRVDKDRLKLTCEPG